MVVVPTPVVAVVVVPRRVVAVVVVPTPVVVVAPRSVVVDCKEC